MIFWTASTVYVVLVSAEKLLKVLATYSPATIAVVSNLMPALKTTSFFLAFSTVFPSLANLLWLPHLGFGLLIANALGLAAPTTWSVGVWPAAGAWLAMRVASMYPMDLDGARAMRRYAAAIGILCVYLFIFLRGFARTMVYPAPIVATVMDVAAARRQILTAGFAHHRTSSKLDVFVYTNAASPVAAARASLVVYLGGNGEVAEFSAEAVKALADATGAKYGLVYNPRGVAGSAGAVPDSEDELIEDGAQVVAWAMDMYALREQDIILFGHSIGGGVASALVAYRYRQCSLVVDRSFSNLMDAAQSMMPIFPRKLVDALLPHFWGRMESEKHWFHVTHERRLASYSTDDKLIRFTKASLCRLPPFRAGGSEFKYVVQLKGDVQDAHNSPPSAFAGGYPDIVDRMKGFLQQRY
jgi:hypothetical protein